MGKALRTIICTVLLVVILASMAVSVFAASRVTISYNGQIVDSLNGVNAVYYRYNTDSGTGSCADYVKKYYNHVYGVEVHNLLTGKTPLSSTTGCSFMQISFNQAEVGDIGYQTNSRGSGHWFIVKTVVNSNTVTIIEQNWKSGNTCTINRVVTASTAGAKIFRLSRHNSNSSNQAQVLSDLLFDADFYYQMYPDLRNAFGRNAAALKSHWLNYGIREGRVASPFFDATWYMESNPDVKNAYGAGNWSGAYSHFTTYGFWEGRQGSPIFSASYYLTKYADLRNAFGNNYLSAAKHFHDYGIGEMRQASAQFSVSAYSNYNPDVARAFSNPLHRIVHYVSYVLHGSEHRRCV